jgi:DNA-binding NarL/FixJ family response regulator
MKSKNAPITVFIVDDHPMMRHGLAQFIRSELGVEVCGEASAAREALEAMLRLRPTLVILDISLPGKNGLELIKEMRARLPATKILVHSMHDERIYAERVLKAGARGYIMKQHGGDQLIHALRQVLASEIYLSDSMSVSAKGAGKHEPESLASKLTDRELEILHWIGNGFDNAEIALRLLLSIKTVDAHREHIKRKLKLRTSTELNLFAVRWVEADRASGAAPPKKIRKGRKSGATSQAFPPPLRR